MTDDPTIQPLNESLYRTLKERFGSVIIANQGVPMVTSPVRSLLTGKLRHAIVTAGESYRVSCPFCGDTKHRLWIGYYYGQPNSDGENSTWLANCFHNEGACLSDWSRRKELEYKIFGFRNRRDRQQAVPISTGNWQLVEELAAATSPGDVTLLSQLPADHPAKIYLRGRNFDPDYLSTAYGLGYCNRPATVYPLARNRIILPIYMYNQMVGWQARTIVEHEQPKYWFRPGMPKSRMLYNFDFAAKWPFLIVVEGATKVWRIGGPSVAIFGKSLSFYQRSLIEQQWSGKPVMLLLDSDARDNMAGIVREMRNTNVVNLVPVYLPQGMPDPDECEQLTICNFIRIEAARAGVDLPVWW